jgi:hypothetical protein
MNVRALGVHMFRQCVKINVMLRWTVSRPVCLGVKPHLRSKTRRLLLSGSCGFVDLGRPFWREDGSVVCNRCWASLAIHSWVWIPRDWWPYFTVSDSRLHPPRGLGLHIYIHHEEGGPVIPPGTRFPFRRLLRLSGPWWRYSNPSPREEKLSTESES